MDKAAQVLRSIDPCSTPTTSVLMYSDVLVYLFGALPIAVTPVTVPGAIDATPINAAPINTVPSDAVPLAAPTVVPVGSLS